MAKPKTTRPGETPKNFGPEFRGKGIVGRRRQNEIRRFTVDDWYRRLAENAKLDAEVRTPPLGSYEEEVKRERESEAYIDARRRVDGKVARRLEGRPAPAAHNRSEAQAERR